LTYGSRYLLLGAFLSAFSAIVLVTVARQVPGIRGGTD
jgi:hypothetical protein